MKTNTIKSLAVLLAAVCLVGTTQKASAILLDLSSVRYIGYIDDGIPSSGADEASYINHLISLAAGSPTQTIGSETYTRSANVFADLPTAVATDSIKDNSASNTGDFGNGYTYLVAKYDGPNYGEVVWYVGGLTGEFELPTGLGGTSGSQYDISHWSLYNGTENNVPDGGVTAMLLGLAMLGLGGVKRLVRG